jgi:hypothetical protein
VIVSQNYRAAFVTIHACYVEILNDKQILLSTNMKFGKRVQICSLFCAKIRLQKKRQQFLYSVADRGPGIPAEQRKHIFERFWRESGKGSPGAGPGLAIVTEIMKTQRGGNQRRRQSRPRHSLYIALWPADGVMSEIKNRCRSRGQVNESSQSEKRPHYRQHNAHAFWNTSTVGRAVASSNRKFLGASYLASDAQPGRSVAIRTSI